MSRHSSGSGRFSGSPEKPRRGPGGKSGPKTPQEPNISAPFKRLADATEDLIRADARVGFPANKPDVEPETFGYLFPAQETLIHYLVDENTRVVVQVGAWLGKTTLFLRERAPKALVFVVEEWDNEAYKLEPSLNKNFANIDLFDRVPFYETFLLNTWQHRPKRFDDGRLSGVVPMRMGWKEAVGLLTKLGLKNLVDVVYWEGMAKEEDLRALLTSVREDLPGAAVVGDNYKVPEVEAVVKEQAAHFRARPHVEMAKCWTFARVNPERLKGIRDLYTAPVNRGERTVLNPSVVKSDFKDRKSVV